MLYILKIVEISYRLKDIAKVEIKFSETPIQFCQWTKSNKLYHKKTPEEDIKKIQMKFKIILKNLTMKIQILK